MSEQSSGARHVGLPIQEAILTRQLERGALHLMRPGPGRSLFILREPQIGRGVPDLLFLAVSLPLLKSLQSSHLRLESLLQARALNDALSDTELGVSLAHARQVRKELAASPWRNFLAKRKALVLNSMAVEAKISDWHKAVRQAARFRELAHSSVVFMPQVALSRIPMTTLEFNNVGALGIMQEKFFWRHSPSPHPLPISSQAWLLELLLRGLNTGSAYRASFSENCSRAKRKLSTRAE